MRSVPIRFQRRMRREGKEGRKEGNSELSFHWKKLFLTVYLLFTSKGHIITPAYLDRDHKIIPSFYQLFLVLHFWNCHMPEMVYDD